MTATCCAPGCTREAKHPKSSLCGAHYQQWYHKRGFKHLRIPSSLRDELGRMPCRSCKEYLDESEFPKSGKPEVNKGLHTICMTCSSVNRYGVSKRWYLDKLAEQDNKCAICGVDASLLEKRLCVDHDHKCCPGSIACGDCARGLICTLCNRGLGVFNDSINTFRSALEYLEKYQWILISAD